MKTCAVLLACVLLTACAGLNVSWVATASYNTPATTTSTMTPGAEKPVKP